MVVGRRLAFLAGALAILLFGASPATAKPRVGVLVVGDEPDAVGELQTALERSVSLMRNYYLQPSAHLAAEISVPPAAPPPPTASTVSWTEAAALLRAAENAYYAAEYETALSKAALLDDLYRGNDDVPLISRRNLAVLRAAIFAAQSKPEDAAAVARAALALDPQLQVDAARYPAELARLFDSVRAKDVHMVVLTGLPREAQIHIDGRRVGTLFSMPIGQYVMVVRARGYREVAVPLVVTERVTQPVNLALAIDPPLQQVLSASVELGKFYKNTQTELAKLANRAGVDAWIIGGVRTDPPQVRALFWHRQESVASAWLDEATVLAQWVQKTLDEERVVQGSLQNVPISQRSTIGGSTFSAEVVYTLRNRSVAADRTNFSTSLVGIGGRVTGDFAVPGGWLVRADLGWTSLEMSKIVIIDQLSSFERTVSGGNAMHARLSAGIQRGAFALTGGAALEAYRVDDGGLRVLTGYTRLAPRVEALGYLPFNSRVGLDFGLGIEPVALWRESPIGATGNTPVALPGVDWRFEVPYRVGPYTAGLSYAGGVGFVRFSGFGDASINPPLERATLITSHHAVGINLARSF